MDDLTDPSLSKELQPNDKLRSGDSRPWNAAAMPTWWKRNRKKLGHGLNRRDIFSLPRKAIPGDRSRFLPS